MKRVVVLGSTGSVGTQTLDVIAEHPDRLKIVGLAAGRNAETLQKQAAAFGVDHLALFEDPSESGIPCGMSALVDLVTMPDVDLVVVSVAGVIGLVPTVEAIKAGKNIALASKEVLVSAGEIVMPLIRKHGVAITPIDSEHSALFQCLQGYRSDQVSSLIITASGGPFRGWTKDRLKSVTVEQALNHPTWRMGGKITIDSATLMNKGLEAIEARWLFDVSMDQVEVVVHPQSVVHSLVRFKDGSVLGQLGWPDMRLPIAYALLYPERKPNSLKPWSPIDTPNLSFETFDPEVFPSVGLARQAAKIGGTMPCAMNAANEEATGAFLNGRIAFLQIAEIVEKTMGEHQAEEPTLEKLVAIDAMARQFARNLM
jgi:1-deoxy-D-xylulose-5-phosphate reductoisomerase